MVGHPRQPRLKKGYTWCESKRLWIEPSVRAPAGLELQSGFCSVQLSPSGVASCRVCGKVIAKNTYRISTPLSDPRGVYGAIPAWIHSACANVIVPPLFDRWKIHERAGWPEYELENSEDALTSPTATEGASVAADSESDLVGSMHLELWLELYCAGWLSLEPQVRVALLQEINAPVRVAIADEDEEVHVSKVLKPVDVVPGMVCSLLKFQKEGVAWMVHQEKSERIFGGILADEMGMGKTIQTIGCILSHRVYGTQHPERLRVGAAFELPPAHPMSQLNLARLAAVKEQRAKLEQEIAAESREEEAGAEEEELASSPEKGSPLKKKRQPRRRGPPRTRESAAADESALSTTDKCREDEAPEFEREGATLVIAPLAAVLQWQSELAKFAPDLNTLIYHGANRALLVEELERADVVITTYPSIEADYRSIVNKHKLRCQYCDRFFLPSKLRLHLRNMCGPDAVRTARQAFRERKQEQTKQKAMQTLQIGDFQLDPSTTVPTITNIYREIMHAAGRHEEAENFSAAPWLVPRRHRSQPHSDGDDVEATPAQPPDFHDDATHQAEPPHDDRVPAPSRTAGLFRDASFVSEDDATLSTTSLQYNAEVGLGLPARQLSREEQDAATESESQDASLISLPQPFTDVSREDSHGEPASTDTAEQSAPTAEVLEAFNTVDGSARPPLASECDRSPSGVLNILRLLEVIPPETAEGEASAIKPPPLEHSPERKPCVTPLASPIKEASSVQRSRAVSPALSPSVTDIESWLMNSTEAQVKKTRMDQLRSVLQHYGQDEGTAVMRKAELVEAVLALKEREKAPKKEPSSASNKRGRLSTSSLALPERKVAKKKSSDIEPRMAKAESPASGSQDDSPSHTESSCDSAQVSQTESSSESEWDALVPEPASDTESETSAVPATTSQAAKKAGGVGPKGGPGKSKAKLMSKKKSGLTTMSSGVGGESVRSTTSDVDLNYVDLSSSPLHSVKWNRIILDEAHRIKSHATNTCKSVFALKSCGTRWCLTGTPLQNRVHELYSLLRFLRFYPYAYYFCSKRDCHCATLNYSFDVSSYCLTCGHTKMTHFSYFNRKIAKPIISHGAHGEGGLALQALRRDVLNQILLRRTKVERAEDVNLPPLDVLIRKEELSQPEMDFYESLYKQSKTKFDTYTEAGTILHNFAHVFDLLSRLRQAVDHPYMILHGSLAPPLAPGAPQHFTCGICQEYIEQSQCYRSSCDHYFDITCLDTCLAEAPSSAGAASAATAPADLPQLQIGCPVCYQSLTVSVVRLTGGSGGEEEGEEDLRHGVKATATAPSGGQSIMRRINPNEFQSSTKIEVLVQELNLSAVEDKAIVFSQFTSFLYLIEFRLKKEGFKCAVFTGSLSMESRQNIIMNFNRDPDLKVILISLKAGGEGLNLQIANQIYLMDPWWNPAAEMQAIQRAHRIGQTKGVRAVRVIAKNTIEERILQLQQKKQLVFDGTLNNSNQAFQKLSAEDLKFLFQ